MWTKEHTREYNKRYAQTHREQIRVRHREYMRRKRHSRIRRSFEWRVCGLVLLKKSDKTIEVEPLHIRSNLQNQRILELSGLD